MTLDYSNSCYSSVTHSSLTGTLILSAVPFSIITEPITNPSLANIQTSTPTLVPISSVVQLPAFGSCPYQPSAVIASTVSDQSYQRSTGTKTYTFSSFTTDLTTCANTGFTYEATIMPGYSSLPSSWLQFNSNLR